jgi:hypothetical protein
MGTSHPINGREAWGRAPPAHPTGERRQIFSRGPREGLFANKKISYSRRGPRRGRGGIPPAQRVEGPRPVDCGGASRPLGGREVPHPLYKPPPAPKLPFYSAKISKKRKGGEEERRRSGETLFTRRFGGIFSF